MPQASSSPTPDAYRIGQLRGVSVAAGSCVAHRRTTSAGQLDAGCREPGREIDHPARSPGGSRRPIGHAERVLPAPRRSTRMSTITPDHVVSREDVVWSFGPSMTPVLTVAPGGRRTPGDQRLLPRAGDRRGRHGRQARHDAGQRRDRPDRGAGRGAGRLSARRAARGQPGPARRGDDHPRVGAAHRPGEGARHADVRRGRRRGADERARVVPGAADGRGDRGGDRARRGDQLPRRHARRQPRQRAARAGCHGDAAGAAERRDARDRRHARLDGRRRGLGHRRGDRRRGARAGRAGEGSASRAGR